MHLTSRKIYKQVFYLKGAGRVQSNLDMLLEVTDASLFQNGAMLLRQSFNQIKRGFYMWRFYTSLDFLKNMHLLVWLVNQQWGGIWHTYRGYKRHCNLQNTISIKLLTWSFIVFWGANNIKMNKFCFILSGKKKIILEMSLQRDSLSKYPMWQNIRVQKVF